MMILPTIVVVLGCCIGTCIGASLEYSTIGCYKDTSSRAIPTLEGTDSRLDGSYKSRSDAINKCAEVADDLGYSMFAVQDGGWCASSADAYNTYDKYGSSSACKSDGKGGGWGNQVYAFVNTTKDYVYSNIGCYKDTSDRAIPTLENTDSRLDGSYSTRNDPIYKCAEVANDNGYSVFAVQNGGWCASSSDAQNTYSKYGSSDACKSDGEGGGWANEVYHLTPREDYEYYTIGCYKDTSDRAIPTLEDTDSRLDGSYSSRYDPITKCAEVAGYNGYSVFAVQNGGWCASSSDAQNTYDKYGSSDACKSDGEGGGWGNQVYVIV